MIFFSYPVNPDGSGIDPVKVLRSVRKITKWASFIHKFTLFPEMGYVFWLKIERRI